MSLFGDKNSFFYQWFKGFEKGLDEVDSDSRSCLLKHCAKFCADIGVLQSYLKLYQTVNGDRDAFYSRLSEIGNVRGKIVVPNKEYFICFPECACDINTAFGVNTTIYVNVQGKVFFMWEGVYGVTAKSE